MTTERYIESIGRRKTAAARVRITPATKQSITINDRDVNEYFLVKEEQTNVIAPFNSTKIQQKFKVTAVVKGGGAHAQSEAVRHGIARALVEYDAELRKIVKAEGFLKRDGRAKERRKFGLKKARKAPQWSKR